MPRGGLRDEENRVLISVCVQHLILLASVESVLLKPIGTHSLVDSIASQMIFPALRISSSLMFNGGESLKL